MNTKPIVEYNIDKLSLIYEASPSFFQALESGTDVYEYITHTASTVFIFIPQIYASHHKIKNYELTMCYGAEHIKVGNIACAYEDAIRLDIDNRFLYSGWLSALYDFEAYYSLSIRAVDKLDVCCDANQNLPRKLNEMMHSKSCEVSRRGARKDMTDKGNQRLGVKIMDNIKSIARREQPQVSYNFNLTPSGCKKPITLRTYNKTLEIENVSKKHYILDSLGFEAKTVYRLEVSTYWRDLSIQAKRKNGWSHEFIYRNLTNKDFLRDFFIRYINRFSTLTIDGKRISISDFLCLSSS